MTIAKLVKNISAGELRILRKINILVIINISYFFPHVFLLCQNGQPILRLREIMEVEDKKYIPIY